MQRDLLLQQLKEEVEKVEKLTASLKENDEFSQAEAEQCLALTEKLTRQLAVYIHILKSENSLHLKLMQALPKEEEKETPKPETTVIIEELIEEISIQEAPVSVKKIELSINDRFRIINELFNQNQQEFQAAMQQLNSINTADETLLYLNSLKAIYNWKEENTLVKTLYSHATKRFS